MELHKIISLVPGVVCQFRLRPDGSTCISYVSEAAREIYRLDPEEICRNASGVLVHTHPDDLESLMASLQASARGVAPWQHEYRLKFDDGTVRWLYGNALPQREADGSTLWHGFITDITGRRQTEDALRKSEAELRAILDNYPYLTWLKDAEGRYLMVNQAYADYVRQEDPRKVVGKTDFDLWPKELAEKYRADDAEVMASRRQKHVEDPSLDGEKLHWTETFKAPVVDKNGTVLGTTGFARDITERKGAEDLLRFHSEILLNLSEGVLLIRAGDGVIVFANPRLEQMLGYGAGELSGRHISTVNAPGEKSPEAIAEAIMVELGRAGTWEGELRNIRKDGTAFWCHASVRAFDHPQFGRVWIAVHEDITERKRIEQALIDSESRFRTIFNTVSDAIFIHDAETGRIVDVNRRMLEMYGLTHEEALACSMDDLSAGVPPYSSAEAIGKIHLARTKGLQAFEWLARARDGHFFWVEVSLRFAYIGGQQRILAVVRDISERKHVDAELRIAAIAFESEDGMVVTDADNTILRVNHAFTRITGYALEEIIGQTPRLLKSGRHDAAFYAAMWESIQHSGAWHGEIWNRRKNGEVYPEQLTITAVKNDGGDVTHYVATLRDITERKAAEEEIHQLAFYDALTGLPNRRLLDDRLRRAMAASKRSSLYGALMFLDLDNFKPLNDMHGHDAGDLLLSEAARRIASCVREMDTVARFGGDEFVVILGELDADRAESAAQARTVAEKICAILAEPYRLKFGQDGQAETVIEHRCTSSAGVALFIGHKYNPTDVLKWADRAMYQAKEGGRNRVHFYDV